MNSSASQSSFLVQFLAVLWRETVKFKFWVVALFGAISLSVLGWGILNPEVYRASVVIKIENPKYTAGRVEKEVETSAPVLTQLQEQILESGLVSRVVAELITQGRQANTSLIDEVASEIVANLNFTPLSQDVVQVSYAGQDPEWVYLVLTKLSETLVAENNQAKRNVSRSDFLKVDKQVKHHKAKLIEAENSINQLKASNFDGTTISAQTRIASVEGEVESLQLDIEDAETQIKRLEVQLANLAENDRQPYRAISLRDKLRSAEIRLDEVRSLYVDDHPNVLELKLQIEDLKYAIAREEANAERQTSVNLAHSGASALKELLTAEKAKLAVKQRRLARAMDKLKEEQNRLQRIVAHQQQASEFEREYSELKAAYDDLLASKEKARLAMTMDMESKSVVYRINEPARFPEQPVGAAFSQYVVAGPLLGAIVPVFLILLYVQLDPHIRFRSSLERISPVAILGEVPQWNTPYSKRFLRNDVIFLIILLSMLLAAYLVLVVAHQRGLI